MRCWSSNRHELFPKNARACVPSTLPLRERQSGSALCMPTRFLEYFNQLSEAQRLERNRYWVSVGALVIERLIISSSVKTGSPPTSLVSASSVR